MKKYFVIFILLATTACTGTKSRVSGRMAGCNDQTIYIEQVAPSRTILLDSTVINDKGAFKFTVKLPNGEPTLYNLRCNKENIALMLSPKEHAKVYYVPGLVGGYTIEGSKESALIKEISDIMTDGVVKLDSIRNAYAIESLSPEQRQQAARSFTNEYLNIKRKQIRFIIENCGQLASIYALYQRLPNDDMLFNGASDVVYYRMVADSVELNYPNSPYLKSLRSQIESVQRGEQLLSELSKQMDDPMPYPEVDMKDMYGKSHKLSELLGKVFLLDFWSLSAEQNNFRNAELKDIYSRYNELGFEVYQVSVDASKADWVNAVQTQKLPWISVNDFKAGQSTAVLTYVVNSVPANFLFDRNGDIVARNVHGAELEAQLSKLLK